MQEITERKTVREFLAYSNEIAGSQIDIVHIIKILITATSPLAPSIYLSVHSLLHSS